MARLNGSSTPPRGLLTDFGGVLTTNVFDSFADYCRAAGLPPDAISDAFDPESPQQPLLAAVEQGELPVAEFERELATAIGVPPSRAAGLIDGLFAGVRPDRGMRAAIERLRRSGVRTGLVSNSWGLRHYDERKLRHLFDVVVVSGRVGLRKPDRPIYELAASQMEVDADELVLVDDLLENLDAPAQMGMTVVHHTETEATLAKLERLFGLALRDGAPASPRQRVKA